MSGTEQEGQTAGAGTQTTEEVSLLEQAISATKQTERSQSEELLKTLTQQALTGTVTWDRNLTVTLNKAIADIDKAMSKQLAAILHSEKLQKLEGSWRGLHYLVMNSETGTSLKIKVFNAKKKEVFKDLDKAVEFDQSQTFKKLYESEFGTPGGEPYGALVGDYEFTNHPEDIDMLTNMSNVAAGAFCPFISAADPKMFGFEDWTELSKPRDLEPSPLNEPFTPPSVIPDDWDIMNDTNESQQASDNASREDLISSKPNTSIPQNESIFDDDDIFSSLENFSESPNQSDLETIPPPSPMHPSPTKTDRVHVAKPTEGKTSASEQAMNSLFLGLGVDPNQIPIQDKAAFFHKLGALTRCSVEGLMAALRARSTIKSSFRVNKTTISPVENNPLKFVSNTNDALITLLSEDKSGYMSAEQAFDEGFKDLQTHQMALMAGMQATINAITKQFDPNNLEQIFEEHIGSSLIPGQKKSKNWEYYVEFHAKLSERLQDDFQNVYGEEFAQAYEQQINKLLSQS